MIGEVVNTAKDTDTTVGPPISFCDSRQFTCGSEFIQNISTNLDSTAWIHQDKSTKNLLVDISGQELSEMEAKTDFGDFIVLDNGDHVFTHFGGKEIRKVSSTGRVTVVCSTEALGPTGISMSRHGHMMVCLCDCRVPDITTDSRGEVHLINMSGKVMRKYGADRRTKLFTNPKINAQNVNLDICVVDFINSNHETNIIGVILDGRKKFIYTGQASLEKKFSAQDICCDGHGRILLTDFFNHAIHVLSAEGQFLQYLLTAQDDLVYPRSLALRDDKLWIGCQYGVIRVVKLKSN